MCQNIYKVSQKNDSKKYFENSAITMPIKYPGPYSPRYHNPNWGPYSRKKITWDAHNKKKSTVVKSTKSTAPAINSKVTK